MNKLIFFGLILVLSGCSGKKNNTLPETKAPDGQTLLEVNRFLVEKDIELIEAYIQRRNWNMEKVEYGYWYTVFDTGHGSSIKKGDALRIEFKESLLDGSVLYSSQESGPKILQTGQGSLMNGLEDGISLLNIGDSAAFIFPPSLAYGLPGDGKRVPRRSIIVYELRILEIIRE